MSIPRYQEWTAEGVDYRLSLSGHLESRNPGGDWAAVEAAVALALVADQVHILARLLDASEAREHGARVVGPLADLAAAFRCTLHRDGHRIALTAPGGRSVYGLTSARVVRHLEAKYGEVAVAAVRRAQSKGEALAMGVHEDTGANAADLDAGSLDFAMFGAA